VVACCRKLTMRAFARGNGLARLVYVLLGWSSIPLQWYGCTRRRASSAAGQVGLGGEAYAYDDDDNNKQDNDKLANRNSGRAVVDAR